jgi:hypothetical protein
VRVLQEWVTFGCPTQTGNPRTKEEIWEVVKRGPHQSALTPEAITHFAEEAAEKVCNNQAPIVAWDDIKDNPPRELMISQSRRYLTNQKRFAQSWTYLSGSN